ncbi:unnamed protein product, partial [Mesorhabditis belari]|uniref:NTR domain-containing protein n=1 Tax=Mesorhabditis belari TaxID=2138241 RepID=A0AAF3F394_9BILA
MFFCYLLIIFAIIPSISVCLCAPSPVNATFCQADWGKESNGTLTMEICDQIVPKPKNVELKWEKLRITKQPLPEGSTRKGLNNLRYGVEHLQVFKKPSNLSTLPNEIFTPSEPPACGLIVEAGREYLLAGSLNGDALYTVLCGQILPDNKLGETIESRLEWKNIPNGYEKVLQGFQC